MDSQLIALLFLLIAGTAALVQLAYIWVVFGKFAFYKPLTQVNIDTEPVSVIIAARNESENLKQFLPAILEQDYPSFEVVVVNDCSWDDSQQVLEEMQTRYPHLKVSQLIEQEKYPTGKKFALTIGIKAASYERMIFTDADCIPSGNQWLRLMQQRFTQGKEIVIGFSPYRRYPGLLNGYIRFESLMTAMFYFSAALLKMAFMGVGRNMAYTKTVFFRHKGFASHKHILSGDDDLFVNEAANASNVAIAIEPESFVLTEPKRTFAAYSHQKTRHMTTGKFYKSSHKWLLGSFYTSHLLFYAGLISALCTDINTWQIVTGLYLLRLVSQYVVYYQTANKLKSTSILWALPILDLIYVVYIYIYGTAGLFTRKRKTW